MCFQRLKTELINFVLMRGRVSLTQYLRFMAAIIVFSIAFIYFSPSGDNGFLMLLFWLPLCWIIVPFSITIRRFHDVGLSGKSVIVTTFILIALFLILCGFLYLFAGVASVGGRTTFPEWIFPVFGITILGFIGILFRNTIICLTPGQEGQNAYGLPPGNSSNQ